MMKEQRDPAVESLCGSSGKLTRDQARRYVDRLTYEELIMLNELLKGLAQKRPPSAAPQESTPKAG